jgi:hypothetical protein
MDSFSSLMEFAVAIAGFSGITMAVLARSAVVHEAQAFRNSMLIAFALSAAFSSAMPAGCAHLGATGSQIWSWSSVSFALVCGALIVAPFAVRSSLSSESRSQLSRTIWIVSVGGTLLVLISQVVNAAGILGKAGSAPLYLGILWLILLAALMYARMLIGLRHSSAV